MGDEERARRDQERAQELEPQTALDHFHLGELARETHSGDPIPHYRAAIALEPGHAPSLMRLGEHYRSVGQLKLAELCYTGCIAQFPHKPSFYDYRGRLYLELGEVAKATADFRKMLEVKDLDPDPWRFLELRGRAYRRLKRHPEAMADLSAALEAMGEETAEAAGVYHERGHVHEELRRFAEAEADYYRAAELDPMRFGEGTAWIYTQGAREFRNLPKAVAVLKKTIEARQQHIDTDSEHEGRDRLAATLHDLGHLAERTGDRETVGHAYIEFVSLSEKLRRKFPEEEKYKIWLAEGYFHRAFLETTELTQRVADLTKAHELRPEMWSYLELRGQALSELKDYARAIDDFNAALETIDRTMERDAADCASEVRWYRGQTWVKLGQFKEAAADFDRAAQLHLARFGGQVARLYEAGPPELRNPKKALALIQKNVDTARQGVVKSPDSPRAREHLAKSLLGLADYLERSGDRTSATATRREAMAHWHLGDWQAAVMALKESMVRRSTHSGGRPRPDQLQCPKIRRRSRSCC